MAHWALYSLFLEGSAPTVAKPFPRWLLANPALFFLIALRTLLTLHCIFTCFLFVSPTSMRAGPLPTLLAVYSHSIGLGVAFGGCSIDICWLNESRLFSSHPLAIGRWSLNFHKHGKSYYKWNLPASERISEDQVTLGQHLHLAG